MFGEKTTKDVVVPIRISPLHPDARMPVYASAGASGADLFSVEKVSIPYGGHALVKCGFAIQIPFGFEAQIRSRSGLALKKEVAVLNSPGTIDSDYRGEIGVILRNYGRETFHIEVGDRIAQMVIAPVQRADFQVADLDDTDRGSAGFGSTGVRSTVATAPIVEMDDEEEPLDNTPNGYQGDDD